MTRGRAYVRRGRAKIIPPDRKKTIRKEFQKLYFEKQKKDEALQKLSSITPMYLYRYCSAHLTSDTRGFSSLVSMIENKDFYVWFTSPHKFNDPYDSFISPDMSNLYSAFRPLVDYIPIFIERLFQILRQTSVPESNEEQKKVLYPAMGLADFNFGAAVRMPDGVTITRREELLRLYYIWKKSKKAG